MLLVIAGAPIVISTAPDYLPLTGGTIIISGTYLYSATASGAPLPTVTIGGQACTGVAVITGPPAQISCTAPNLGSAGAQPVVLTLNGVASSGATTVAYLGAPAVCPTVHMCPHHAAHRQVCLLA